MRLSANMGAEILTASPLPARGLRSNDILVGKGTPSMSIIDAYNFLPISGASPPRKIDNSGQRQEICKMSHEHSTVSEISKILKLIQKATSQPRPIRACQTDMGPEEKSSSRKVRNYLSSIITETALLQPK